MISLILCGIIYFAFGQDKETKSKEVIYISYDNTQFGYLDKENGKFIFGISWY